jgi:hypothetical protein
VASSQYVGFGFVQPATMDPTAMIDNAIARDTSRVYSVYVTSPAVKFR